MPSELNIDPVATFISKTKVHRYNHKELFHSWQTLRARLSPMGRADEDYNTLKFSDVDPGELERTRRSYFVPAIPNIEHWFNRYVIIDLAKLLDTINAAPVPITHKSFFRLAFASIIRSASNADPVPVSGLEVTKHMRRLIQAGRLINPFDQFERAVARGIAAVRSYLQSADRQSTIKVLTADATNLKNIAVYSIDAVITSPPYHGAVDYYRRHALEMYWLGFTKNHEERLKLLPQYLGRPKVPAKNLRLCDLTALPATIRFWHERMKPESQERANSFLHYITGIRQSIAAISRVLRPGSPAVFVVGRSTWNGDQIPTAELLAELAEPWFAFDHELWYPLRNRYMSYSRRNGADINQEQVLVLKRRQA